MKVSIVGSGYVGLVTGACLAEKGHEVICVDLDADKVLRINAGEAPIYEAGLHQLLQDNVGRRLQATTGLRDAVLATELTLIAVGTPFDGSGIDLNHVRRCARDIGVALREKTAWHGVIVKSTVVPGTTDRVVLPILAEMSGKQAGPDFGVGMNPEFLREGAAVDDFMNPDRIVLGASDARMLAAMEELYAPFTGAEIVRTTPRTAEMIKYTANSFLATLISFSNEIANVCAATGGIDVLEVMHGVRLDRRISPVLPDGQRVTPDFTTYLDAGCGFGGSCFPKDVLALIAHGEQQGSPMRLLNAVMRVNERQPEQVVALLRRHFTSLAGLRVVVLGLAFKPGTDDVRESPALPVIRHLLSGNALVRAYDPVATSTARQLLGDGIEYARSLEDAVRDADAVVLLTRWEEFDRLPEVLAAMPHQPLVVDGRRQLPPRSVARYEGIGLSLRDSHEVRA